MSDLIVEIVKIHTILPHPNADNLVQVKVKGWTIISGKDNLFQVGENVVFFPLESLIPKTWSDKWEITKYLKDLPKDHKLYSTHRRLCAAKLRGETSYGFIVRPDRDWELGFNCREYYGIEKYEPDPGLIIEDNAKENSLFHKYTDIQNYKNFPNTFTEEDIICITCKLHGFNSRLGYVLEGDSKILMAGSHNQRKKSPSESLILSDDMFLDREGNPLSEELKQKRLEGKKKDRGLYWWALQNIPGIEKLLKSDIFDASVSVIVWGEGIGRQDLKYGCTNGNIIFNAFDISVDGKYLDYDEFKALCLCYNIPLVPELYYGKYYPGVIEEYTSGNTRIRGEVGEEIKQIREGVVAKTVKEEKVEVGGLRKFNNGRKILKSISDEYITRKGNRTENH